MEKEEKEKMNEEAVLEKQETENVVENVIVESEYDKLLKEKNELYDKFLRLQADFDNYRKRMVKEKGEFAKYIEEDIVLELLNVMDNFDRAIDAVCGTTDIKNIVDGIKLVQKQFHETLEKRGLTKVDSIGKLFDPNLHEAISCEHSEDVKEDHIIEEFQKGYMLKGKIIRHPKVKVSKKNQDEKDTNIKEEECNE